MISYVFVYPDHPEHAGQYSEVKFVAADYAKARELFDEWRTGAGLPSAQEIIDREVRKISEGARMPEIRKTTEKTVTWYAFSPLELALALGLVVHENPAGNSTTVVTIERGDQDGTWELRVDIERDLTGGQ